MRLKPHQAEVPPCLPLSRVALFSQGPRHLSGTLYKEGSSYKVNEWVSESRSVMSNYMVHGIFQARILEWLAFPFSRGSSQPGVEPRSPALQTDSLPAEPPGKPLLKVVVSSCIPPLVLQEFHWRGQWGNRERDREGVGAGGACLWVDVRAYSTTRARISAPQLEQISSSILVWGYTKEFAQRAPFFTNIQKLKTTKLAWEQLHLAHLSPSWTSEWRWSFNPWDADKISHFQLLPSISSGPGLAVHLERPSHQIPTSTLSSSPLYKGTSRQEVTGPGLTPRLPDPRTHVLHQYTTLPLEVASTWTWPQELTQQPSAFSSFLEATPHKWDARWEVASHTSLL